MTERQLAELNGKLVRLSQRVSALEKAAEDHEKQNRLSRFGAYWTKYEIAEALKNGN